jgi:hypothetical protein
MSLDEGLCGVKRQGLAVARNLRNCDSGRRNCGALDPFQGPEAFLAGEAFPATPDTIHIPAVAGR